MSRLFCEISIAAIQYAQRAFTVLSHKAQTAHEINQLINRNIIQIERQTIKLYRTVQKSYTHVQATRLRIYRVYSGGDIKQFS